MNKKLFSCTFVILMLSFISISGQNDDEYLQQLIDEAIQVSPQIQVSYSKLNASISRIEIGTNLPDPLLTLGLLNLPTNSFSFTQEPMTGKMIGLSQTIPFPGALSSASDVKAVDTLIIREEIEDLKNQIRRDVSKFYYELRLTRGEIVLAGESKILLHKISEVAKSNYEVSRASLHNIIQVEVQITRVRDKIEILNGKEESLIAELNALLIREETSPIITDEISPIEKFDYTTGTLITLAKEKRPFLKGIKFAEEKTRLMEENAEYAFYPDFKFGLQYSQRDYIERTGANLNDLFSVVVGITLPINYGGNKSAKVSEAQFLQILNRDRYSASIQTLNQNFGKITAKIRELKIRENLITESLLPQAEQSLQAALADYQVAKIDFVNVIQAEEDILKIKTELIKVRTKFYTSLTQLEFLTGEKIINNKL
ncbi:MAG: TolC family protein [Melioribacteraceae bacterium]|nr:TolC family protein [Melioribacteraceae bacterium]